MGRPVSRDPTLWEMHHISCIMKLKASLMSPNGDAEGRRLTPSPASATGLACLCLVPRRPLSSARAVISTLNAGEGMVCRLSPTPCFSPTGKGRLRPEAETLIPPRRGSVLGEGEYTPERPRLTGVETSIGYQDILFPNAAPVHTHTHCQQ